MKFTFRPMRLRDALAVSRWRYSGEYAFYNPGMMPLLVWFVERPIRFFGMPVYYSVWDEHGKMAGIFSFVRHGAKMDVVEIGVALRPGLTGQRRGLGLAFVAAGLSFARARYSPRRFTLDVATFNHRAQRVYEQAGFRTSRTTIRRTRGRMVEYLEMERDA